MTDLYVNRGDDAQFAVEVTQADGVTVQSIAGATLKFTAKDKRSDADGSAIIAVETGSGIVHDDEPNGLATITVPAAATDAITTKRTLEWDLQITDGSGNIRTLDGGRLYVLPDVTRAG